MGRPGKICRGVRVIRPKKRAASKRIGPDGLSGKWVVPANLPGDEGGAIQKADIHQVVYPSENTVYINLVSGCRANFPTNFPPKFPGRIKELVRNFGRENGSTRKRAGGAGGATHKFGRTQLFRYTRYPE